MDEIVKKAIAKWPDVPHCYGWLALDARGSWRMRDERAQHLGLPGDKITQAALLGFINRNYAVDARGRWYFQNGPQRVYVDLEATPFIARTDPEHALVLHTGEPLAAPEQVFFTFDGELIVQGGGKAARLDDRDVAQLIARLELDGAAVSDAALLAWLDGQAGALALRLGERLFPVQRIDGGSLEQRFGFERAPRAA